MFPALAVLLFLVAGCSVEPSTLVINGLPEGGASVGVCRQKAGDVAVFVALGDRPNGYGEFKLLNYDSGGLKSWDGSGTFSVILNTGTQGLYERKVRFTNGSAAVEFSSFAPSK